MNIATGYRTARHTRWSQLLCRLRYALERRRPCRPRALARWRWDSDTPPCLRDDMPVLPVFHRPCPMGSVARLREGEFRHLNESRHLGREQPDWLLGPIAAGRLWAVTLHYHGWAYDLAETSAAGGADAEEDRDINAVLFQVVETSAAGGADAEEATFLFRHYLSDWLARCPLHAPGSRALAWNSYAIATRLTWWIRSHQALGARLRTWGGFEREFLASLWQQAAYLHDHLEWDLRANHLLRDAVGLAWAGRFFAEEQARQWLDTATQLAVEQAREQVLADGGHFERSPMYHLHVMEDIHSLALLVEDDNARAVLRNTWEHMAETLLWLRHPDGDVPLFNDGGLHAACTPDAMLQLGLGMNVALPRGGRLFPQTGMAVWHGEPWTVFFDVGAVGPDYQPGHAHADTLSLECSYRGQRLFVDPGTHSYDHDERRRYDRSTEAHNTVGIDGQDSSEVWHIFRVGRRAYPVNVEVGFSSQGMQATAAHNGYDHLPGRPRHTRRLEVNDQGCLVVTDRVGGGGCHQLRGGLLLAPGWKASAADSGWIVSCGTDKVRVSVRGSCTLNLSQEQRPYHPEYGVELQTTRLVWQVKDGLPVEVTVRAEGA